MKEIYMNLDKEYVSEKYEYFSEAFSSLFENDQKVIDLINDCQQMKELSFVEKCFVFSKDTGLRDDKGRCVFMSEVSWHDIAMSCEMSEERFKSLADTTGAMACGLTIQTDGKDEDINLIMINKDVYDILVDYPHLKPVKYFTLAHEYGHCFNGDLYKSSHKRNTRKEIKADLRAYKLINSGYFGEFEFDPEWVMNPDARRIQHILNYVMLYFGNDNAQYIIDHYRTISSTLKLFTTFWLDDDRYTHWSSEDRARRRAFQKFFKC